MCPDPYGSGDNAVASYTYLPNGREHTFTDFNGNVKTNGFDNLGRLISTSTANMHGTPLGNYSYTLDALGNRTEIWEGTKNIVYSYDELNRLTSETVIDMGNVVFDASYTYDPTGNRLTKTTLADTISYSYDANDRVTLETVTDPEDLPLYSRAYTYDNNGNTLSDGTKTFSYDSKNRLISFTDAADTGIYTYDTAGRRLSKTYGGSTTEYLYCTTCRYAQVLEERDDLGNITAEYYIGNDLISKEDTTQELSYLYDGHGSVRKLINEYGGVPATYNYDAYGILLDSFGTVDNDFRYSGEQYDPELDQYYLRARYYNQNVGRFSSMDDWAGSLSNPITLNKYLYGNGNPVMYNDPSGKSGGLVAFMMGVTMLMYTQNVLAQTAEPSHEGIIKKRTILQAHNMALYNLNLINNELENGINFRMAEVARLFFYMGSPVISSNSTWNDYLGLFLYYIYGKIYNGLSNFDTNGYTLIDDENVTMQVDPTDKTMIYVGPKFFLKGRTTIPSMDGVIVHEASHLFVGTEDIVSAVCNSKKDKSGSSNKCYGENDANNLAQLDFFKALRNADNIRLFYEYFSHGKR